MKNGLRSASCGVGLEADGVAAVEVLEVALVALERPCSDAVAFDAFGILYLLFDAGSRSVSSVFTLFCKQLVRLYFGSPEIDLALTDDAAVLDLEDPVGEDLAAPRELAGHRGGGAILAGDKVSTVASRRLRRSARTSP